MKKQEKNPTENPLSKEIMTREIISKLLDTDILSGVQTKILKEHLVYGKSPKEIAPIFNLTYFRVKQIIENAYAILKSRLSANQELFSRLQFVDSPKLGTLANNQIGTRNGWHSSIDKYEGFERLRESSGISLVILF